MDINKREDGTNMYIELSGRLDVSTSQQLIDNLDSLEGITYLEFELGKLVYVSSAGIRAFILAQRKVGKNGKTVFKNPTDDVMKVFTLAGLTNGFFNIEKD